jgi:uroporphyrinogen-III synthase
VDAPAPDYLLFGSGGAVKALFASGYVLGENTTPVCIGPVTAKAIAQSCPGVPYLQAAQATTAALVETVLADQEGKDMNAYKEKLFMEDVYSKLAEAESQIGEGNTVDARSTMKSLREKYDL